jgi:alpha-beta hydrolase superfamily lysophospholipase
MADARVEAAIEHWAARMIQNGVDYNDFVRTTARIETWEQWLPEWTRTADEHEDCALASEHAGRGRTAGEAWLRAAVCRHFGKFVWMLDSVLAAEATHRSVEAMRRAHRHLDPSAERIEAPLDGARVVANLRRPPGARRPPLVVLIPGLDSTKEEFFFLEEAYLVRGMATLSVDGPGQGESGLDLPIRSDFETGVAPLLDAVAGRADIDHARIGAMGVSLGGYYAPRVAAFEPRIKAMVALSGPFCFGETWEGLPPMTRQTFAVRSGASTDDDARERAMALDLSGVCERIDVPALYVTGKLDRLIPWRQTERQARRTPGGEFVCYPDGNHGCSNKPLRARPAIADWMRERLAEVAR